MFDRIRISVVLVVMLRAVPAHAQATPAGSLRAPSVSFAAAATADWITTYRRLSEAEKCDLPNRLERGVPFCVYGREHSVLLQPFNSDPIKTIAAGAAMDVVTLFVARKIGKRHPKFVKVALYGATAFRGFIAARNEIRLQRDQATTRAMNEAFISSRH